MKRRRHCVRDGGLVWAASWAACFVDLDKDAGLSRDAKAERANEVADRAFEAWAANEYLPNEEGTKP